MSTDTERLGEETDLSLLESWKDWYYIPVVGVAMLFMFWTRVRNYEAFITDDGTPALAAVDSWYHWRTIEWTAENYPSRMPYEIWTAFPTGQYVGQFGTLFDQLVVTVAMIVGLGDPSTETLYLTGLFVVPAMAALVAIPVFLIGRRLGGSLGGVVAVLLLALAPGSFFSRTTTGQLQHHVAEVLFMALAVLAMMVALRVAEEDLPIWELVVDRDWDALRRPAAYSALAGVALSLYLWVWPPGVVLLGIFGVFFMVQLSMDQVAGRSPDHVAFVGAISMFIPGVFMLAMVDVPVFDSTTSFGLLQPSVALIVAFGCLFMAWLAREWNARGIERSYYPVSIAGLVVVTMAVMAVVLPDLFDTIVSNVTDRILPFGAGEGAAATIQEAAPPENFVEHAYDEFGMAFYTMLVGLIALAARPLMGREYRTEYTLILVWSLFLISMGMTQIRFAYYLLLPVVVVNAVFVQETIEVLDLDRAVDSIRTVEAYQVIVVVMVVSLLFVPLLPPVQGAAVWERGDAAQPHDEAMTWEEANHWMAENTPEPGDWAGADNASKLDYYGVYDHPGEDGYEYPAGAYGVMSWWDYGHLITVQGERMSHANPFQTGATSSSAYFQADSEELAEAKLAVIAEGEDPSDYADEEILAMAEEADSHEEVRYVMIDDAMAGGKFSAITEWTGPGYGTYLQEDDYTFAGQEQALPTTNENFDDTVLSSLYVDDADGMEQYRLVHENDDYAVVGGMMFGTTPLPQFSQPLDIGWGEQAQLASLQLQQAREEGVVSQELGLPVWDAHLVSSVKTFERVEGATIAGSIDEDDAEALENETVTASVSLQSDPGRVFAYTQEATVEDGSFELTVPYATDDELGVDDGYTNSSVEALDEYELVVQTDDAAYNASAAVSETAVVEGEAIDVVLEEIDEDELEPEGAEEEPELDEVLPGDGEVELEDGEDDAEADGDTEAPEQE